MAKFPTFTAMIQEILVLVVFAAAVAYVGRLVYQNFHMKSGCASGCGKCGIDFEKINRHLEKKSRVKPTP